VGEYLGALAVLRDGHVLELFEQRKVDVGLDVAGQARVAVPVPGAAEVAALLEDAEVLHPALAQARPGQEAAEAAADQRQVDLVGEGLARVPGLDAGIPLEVSEGPRHLHVLVVSIGPKALVPLFAVLLAKHVRVESELRARLRAGGRHRVCPLRPPREPRASPSRTRPM